MTIKRSTSWTTAWVLALSSAPAIGAGLDSEVRAPRRGVTVEVKPLPTLLSTIPGVGAASAGVELEMRNGTAPFVEATAFNTDLPERFDAKGKEEMDLYPNRLKGGAVDFGARIYARPGFDSWYGGAKVGYAAVSGQWAYHDATIDHRVTAYMPGVNGGYRWLWQNRLVVRAGAGLAINLVQSQDVTRHGAEGQAAEAEDKVKDKFDTPVLANVDLGLGYMF
jgi:hypothetical protein